MPGTDLVPGSQGDDTVVSIPLPFTYNFYGQPYTSVNAGTNGHIQFNGSRAAFANADPQEGGVKRQISKLQANI